MSSQDIYFLTDSNGHKTHAVMPIATYEELLSLAEMVKYTATKSRNEIYSYKSKRLVATGYPIGVRSKPGFVLIKGAQVALNTVASLPDHIRELREEYLGDGTLILDAEHSCFVTTKDLKLQSPSIAACIVAGNVRNGLSVWMNREGFSLKDSGYGIKKTARKQG